jgi:hypothetical protein
VFVVEERASRLEVGVVKAEYQRLMEIEVAIIFYIE